MTKISVPSCRFCLTNFGDSKMIKINKDVIQQYEDLTQFKFNSSNIFSHYCCELCLRQLQLTCLFKSYLINANQRNINRASTSKDADNRKVLSESNINNGTGKRRADDVEKVIVKKMRVQDENEEDSNECIIQDETEDDLLNEVFFRPINIKAEPVCQLDTSQEEEENDNSEIPINYQIFASNATSSFPVKKEIHKDVPRFDCFHCESDFCSATGMRRHIQSVHMKMRFTCLIPNCGVYFGRKAGLAKHFIKAHPEVEHSLAANLIAETKATYEFPNLRLN